MPVQQVSTAKTLTGDELLRIGEVHDHQRHFPETLTYYQLALSTFREHQQARGMATALVKIAQVYERQGKIQDADLALQEALPLFARSSDRTAHARALLVRGRVSARLGRLDNARTSFSQAITLFERAHDRQGWNESLVQLGLLDVGDGVTEPGLSLLQQARQDARTRQDRGQQLAAVVALGNAHWLLNRADAARQFYDEGLHLAEVERNMTIEAMLRLRLAQLDGEDERLTEGIELGKRALLLSQTLRDAATEAATLSLLADLYRKMGRNAEAEESEQRALSIYRSRQILVHGAR
ncbi:MAG: tetratricopeptide repeat protein [Nitrospirota bacterium]|nr:tetratricopeptide repeat protein [Nitrospirota bacterium]